MAFFCFNWTLPVLQLDILVSSTQTWECLTCNRTNLSLQRDLTRLNIFPSNRIAISLVFRFISHYLCISDRTVNLIMLCYTICRFSPATQLPVTPVGPACHSTWLSLSLMLVWPGFPTGSACLFSWCSLSFLLVLPVTPEGPACHSE